MTMLYYIQIHSNEAYSHDYLVAPPYTQYAARGMIEHNEMSIFIKETSVCNS